MRDESKENDKIRRILELYTKLFNGHSIHKAEEAANYGVSERSIQRDIADISSFLDDFDDGLGVKNSIKYNGTEKAYSLERMENDRLTNSEILAVCKILLDSRAFTKKEMSGLLARLMKCCVPEENQKLVQELIGNEEHHYIEPRHKKVFMDLMWDMGQAIHKRKYIEISYRKLKNKEVVKRKLKPVAIMFSEYYFYLAAFIDDEEIKQNFKVIDDVFPTIYRIDRIQSYEILEEQFRVIYSKRFQEGEFRKRIQFMYGGKLQRIRFKYFGSDIDAILDRLPTAEIQSEKDGIYTLKAEVFGKGIDMWLRSQGDLVEVISEEKKDSS